MRIKRTAALILFTPLFLAPPVLAQQVQPTSRQAGALSTEAVTTLTQAWAFLAQGDLQRAAEKARLARQMAPRGAAALMVGVEVEIARAGASAGLSSYEQWLGGRRIEEPAVVRRIAEALLRECAANPQDVVGRVDALAGLAAGGDGAAAEALARTPSLSSGEARALARFGNQQAIRELLGELKIRSGNTLLVIEALGDSRSPDAVAPLVATLGDSRSEMRGAAADALGRIGDPSAVPQLKLLLTDQSSYVRLQAAGALYRLDDDSGVNVLREQLAASESSAAGRLAAAEAMASRPDAEWQALVRALLDAPEAHLRLAAARLISPYDPALARSVLNALGSDPNPAIRDEAGRIFSDVVGGDFAVLRAMLRHPEPRVRLRAAARILEITS